MFVNSLRIYFIYILLNLAYYLIIFSIYNQCYFDLVLYRISFNKIIISPKPINKNPLIKEETIIAIAYTPS